MATRNVLLFSKNECHGVAKIEYTESEELVELVSATLFDGSIVKALYFQALDYGIVISEELADKWELHSPKKI